MKVLIIGGGASGMAAALSAARDPANSVTLLERQARVGRKLLATGNGRCNLTNRELGPEHYHGEQPEFALPALRTWGVETTLAEFRRLGLVTVTEPGGRVLSLLRSGEQRRGCPALCAGRGGRDGRVRLRGLRGQKEGARLSGAGRDRGELLRRPADRCGGRLRRAEARRNGGGLSCC